MALVRDTELLLTGKEKFRDIALGFCGLECLGMKEDCIVKTPQIGDLFKNSK